jgi:GDPmannose 4,6-dehydratase
MTKTSLITGITGMDGSYLTELLLSKGYEVHGLVRRNSANEVNNIKHLQDKITIHYGDMIGDNDLALLIHDLQPDEFYNLAGQSDVALGDKCPQYTIEVNGLAVVQILENLKTFSPKTRFYQASTSELFGNSPAPQNELTPISPVSYYAIGKSIAYHAVIKARQQGLFACNGILFNHESPRRGLNFVTRKVTRAVANIVYGNQKELRMGNLNAVRDWGFAGDYVNAMWLMLQQKQPDDFVIGTGRSHSIQELLEVAFGLAGLKWQDYVVLDDSFKRPVDVNCLRSDPTKAWTWLNWKATTTFEDLIKMMLDHDLKEVQRIVEI